MNNLKYILFIELFLSILTIGCSPRPTQWNIAKKWVFKEIDKSDLRDLAIKSIERSKKKTEIEASKDPYIEEAEKFFQRNLRNLSFDFKTDATFEVYGYVNFLHQNLPYGTWELDENRKALTTSYNMGRKEELVITNFSLDEMTVLMNWNSQKVHITFSAR